MIHGIAIAPAFVPGTTFIRTKGEYMIKQLIRLHYLFYVTFLSVFYDSANCNNKHLPEGTLRGIPRKVNLYNLSVLYSFKYKSKLQEGQANRQTSDDFTNIKTGFS